MSNLRLILYLPCFKEMQLTTIFILGIVFIATLIRSTFGFGESLIAVPLLSFFLPISIAVPFSVLLSITIALVVVIQDHQQIHFHSAKWLIFYAIAGIPIGLLLLIYGNEQLVKRLLGILIILYSTYSLISLKFSFKKRNNGFALLLCGFFSGILGGAYGLNGPPLVLYGKMQNWSAKQFRATLQAYFLPVSILAMLGYWYKGLWNSAVTHYFIISIPVVIPVIFLGRWLNHSLKNGGFFRFVYIGLIIAGLLLLIQSLLQK